MIVSLIAAHGKNFEIGLDGGMPWRLSTDLKRFKEITLGHHIVMGRKTFESFGIKKPLPQRINVVITRNKNYQVPEGVVVVSSLDEALAFCNKHGESEAFVIGGGEIYTQALEVADRLYLTQVDYSGPADTYFPDYRKHFGCVVHEELVPLDAKNQFNSIYKILEKEK